MALWLDSNFSDEEELVGVKRSHFEGALQTWVAMRFQAGPAPTVAEAMLAFNTTQRVIEQTVIDGYWLYSTGSGVDATIELDGE